MGSEAGTLLQLVLLQAWMMLENTPATRKNVHFSMFLTSQEVLKSVAAAAYLQLAPGLMDVVQASSPPSIAFFKNLAAKSMQSVKFWAVYFIIMERIGSRPRLYVGSATKANLGVKERFRSYDNREMLPKYVEESLDDGFTITHKGLLCWCPLPTASIVPVTRLLFVLLEATFTYMFWAMHPDARDVDRTECCPWDSVKFEFDGLCSHCALNEGIDGDFDLSPEQLEAKGEARKEKGRLATVKFREENREEVNADNRARYRRFNDDNPGYLKEYQATRRADAVENNTFHCESCNQSFTTKNAWENHLVSDKHKNRLLGNFAYLCEICNVTVSRQRMVDRHNKSDAHIRNLAAAQQSGNTQKKTGSLPAFKPPLKKNPGSPTALPPAKKPKLPVPAPVQAGTSRKSSGLPKFKLPIKTQASIKDFFTASNKENLAPVPQDSGKESDGDY